MSFWSMRTRPDHGFSSPHSSFAMVDLPLPDPPTSATRAPGAIDKLKSSMSGGSVGLYPNLTLSSSMKPRGGGTAVRGLRSSKLFSARASGA